MTLVYLLTLLKPNFKVASPITTQSYNVIQLIEGWVIQLYGIHQQQHNKLHQNIARQYLRLVYIQSTASKLSIIYVCMC